MPDILLESKRDGPNVSFDIFRKTTGPWEFAVASESKFGSPTLWSFMLDMLQEMTGVSSFQLAKEIRLDLSKCRIKTDELLKEKPFASSHSR